MVLPTVLTIALILLLVAVLLVGLIHIVRELERIGGPDRAYMGENMGHRLSLLAKARWGVRAIERQTRAIEPEVSRLNEGLSRIDAVLDRIQSGFEGILAALRRQGSTTG